MKKIIVGCWATLGFVPTAFAGSPIGFSTLRLNWSPTASGGGTVAEAIPTLGTWGSLLLAILLALVVYRMTRKRDALVRAVAPLLTFGLAAATAFVAESPVAGLSIPPPIGASSCSGSSTYTANSPTPPPCFVNTCGAPVTVSYTFVSGQGPTGDPLTAETCTFDYYCDGASGTAAQGASIPSDGASLATAYCVEIFGEGPP